MGAARASDTMPSGRFMGMAPGNDKTLVLSKGNFFPLHVPAPAFDRKAKFKPLGAPVRGATANEAQIAESFLPPRERLRRIPGSLPDLALGQRWAKVYFEQALQQRPAGCKRLRARRMRGIRAEEACVGRNVVHISAAEAYNHCERLRADLSALVETKASLEKVLKGPWEARPDCGDLRRKWDSLVQREQQMRVALAQRSAEQHAGVITSTEGKARLPDGAISVQWACGDVVRYYATLGGTCYPLVLSQMPRAKTAQSGPEHPDAPKHAKGAFTLVLGLNAAVKEGAADRAAAARRRRSILKKCLKNLQNALVVKCFRKFVEYRRPNCFCLLTLQPIDGEKGFYQEPLQQILEATPKGKGIQEEWQKEVCLKALDADWIAGRQEAHQTLTEKGRESSMTSFTAMRMSITNRKANRATDHKQCNMPDAVVERKQWAPRGFVGSKEGRGVGQEGRKQMGTDRRTTDHDEEGNKDLSDSMSMSSMESSEASEDEHDTNAAARRGA